MIIPNFNYLWCANQYEKYRMFYTTWGKYNPNKVVLCVHGLNRNGREFDYLANYFVANGYFVIAPDIAGRGNSDFLQNILSYDLKLILNDLISLVDALKLNEIIYIGTSMGGLLGLFLAQFFQNKIKRLILNDIGIIVNELGLERIKTNLESWHDIFNSFQEALDFYKSVSHGYGELPDNIWEELTLNTFQMTEKGFVWKIDPQIRLSFLNNYTQTLKNLSEIQLNNVFLQAYENIKIPCMIIRGEYSTLLSEDTVSLMKKINPIATSLTIARAAHAPLLYTKGHYNLINDFIEKSF